MTAWLLVWLLIAPSEAATERRCPWAGDESPDVRARMTQVIVNERHYRVKGMAAHIQFRELLVACDADRALRPLGDWRQARDTTNTFAIVGILFFPLWVTAVPVSAINAQVKRHHFVEVLERTTPPPRPPKTP